MTLSNSGVDWEFVAQAQGTNTSAVTSGVPSSTLPNDTSWSLESENGTRTINVTIGNYTDTVPAPSEANANSYTDYTREYANLSELKPTTTALLNRTSNLTGISEDRLNGSIGNAGGTIQDSVDDGVREVADTAACASNSSQESEGGFSDKAKDVVDDCNPVNGGDDNDGGDLL